ncbi:MAG: hypothetical protein IKV76_06400 [Clostridia bacterium]|nr:hypothetical protein [Clostridia bacterium]
MLESIKEYWYMWLILVALIVVLVIVMKKAAAAANKRNEIMKQQRENMEHFKAVYEKYKDTDKAFAEECDAAELAEGITTVLQYSLEKSDNPDAEFENAPEWKKNVYALFYFDEDCKTSLSFFFRNNGEPLPSVAVNALKTVGADKLYSTVAQMYSMYDENNENVSLDKNRVAELDEKFISIYNSDEFFALIKNYILDNI